MKSKIEIENDEYPHLTRFKTKNEVENSISTFKCSECEAEYHYPNSWNPIGTDLYYCMKCKAVWEELKIVETKN